MACLPSWRLQLRKAWREYCDNTPEDRDAAAFSQDALEEATAHDTAITCVFRSTQPQLSKMTTVPSSADVALFYNKVIEWAISARFNVSQNTLI